MKRKKATVFHPTETQIETSIGHYLRIKNYFFWKNPTTGYFDSKIKRFRKHASPYARNGIPDLIIVYKGRFIGLEVKNHDGKQSTSQIEFMNDLRAHGKGYYFIVRSIEDVEKAIKEVDSDLNSA